MAFDKLYILNLKQPNLCSCPGMVKVVIGGLDLGTDECAFCVLKCGPHWARTFTHPSSSCPRWNWEVCLQAIISTQKKSPDTHSISNVSKALILFLLVAQSSTTCCSGHKKISSSFSSLRHSESSCIALNEILRSA